MGVLSFISSIISPITNLIGKVVTKEEDRLKVKAAIAKLENEMVAKLLEYEAKLIEVQSKVIVSESQGAGWLQRSWRPITMLTFLGLVVSDTFGLTTFRLAPQAWTLLQIGLGGYVIGRSAEKVLPRLSSLKNKQP